MFGTLDQTTSDMSTCQRLFDLSLLREATSSGRYDLHIQRTIKKLYGAPYLILRGLSSHRVNIRHKVFVSYIRLIEFAAVL